MKPKNRATLEEAVSLRQRILGGRAGGGKLSQARIASDRDVVSTFVTMATRTYTTVQVGMQLPSQGRSGRREDNERIALNRELMWWALINFLGWGEAERSRVVGIEITRIAAERNYLAPFDNLPANLKNVLDAVCAWVLHGEDVLTWGCSNKVPCSVRIRRQKRKQGESQAFGIEKTPIAPMCDGCKKMQGIGRCDDQLIISQLKPHNRVRLIESQGTDQWDANKTGVRVRFKRLREGEKSMGYTSTISLRRKRAKRAALRLRGTRPSLWRYLSS